MILAESVNPAEFLEMPFRDFLLAHLNLADDSLLQTAVISVSGALGNHPDLLNHDVKYREFVSTYAQTLLLQYVTRAAATQLGLLTFGGLGTTARACKEFMKEAEKVSVVVVPNAEASETIFGDPDRRWYFFLAVVALTAYVCHRDRQLGGLFGVRRTFFGKWKSTEVCK